MNFVAEATALGVHVFEAANEAAARAYVETLIAEKGGPVRLAARPAVTRLGLMPQRFDGPLSDVQIGVTQADYALSDTGTLVMISEAGEGRALSLLPPIHV